MSQNTARHDPHATSGDDEEAAGTPVRKPERRRGVLPHQRVGQPADDDGGGVGPDEPDESEFELTGDDDLGPADLGPAAPDFTDPDAGSGRIRKITRKGGGDAGR